MYHIKNDKRSIESSNMIYNALIELIKEKDYSTITITELVDRSKVGRATFYRNFDTIDDVLRLKCDDKFDEFGKYLIEYRMLNDDSQNTILPFLKPFLRFWYVNSSIIELILSINKIGIIHDSFTKMCHNHSVYILNNSSLEHFNYFIAIRSSVFIAILSEWVRNDMNIAPDDLLKILIKQQFSIADLKMM